MKNSIIDEREIWETISKSQKIDRAKVRDILQKASAGRGLDLYEMSVLLHVNDKEMLSEIYTLAKKIKEMIYGNRIVLFIPLYISNECKNICAYCGFRADNKELKRTTLSPCEIKSEVESVQKQGHKRILAVMGEDASFSMDQVLSSIETIYATKTAPGGEIRRVNVNIAPMTVDDFRTLKTSNIGTFQCFQETYHSKTYDKVHLAGTKKDYLWRLNAHHRAQEAGIDDIGMGVLYGLFDPIFDTLAMVQHAKNLEMIYGVGPHTVSLPRMEPAFGSALSQNPPYIVCDDLFRKIVAVLRLTIPYTGMILSTRESAEVRKELLELGISQISVGSKTSPGSYNESSMDIHEAEQFSVGDHRTMDEVVLELIETGYIPSFCTACYRLGRHGDSFMGMAKNMEIKSFCQPNAILTLAEYLEDYGSEQTRETGNKVIDRYISGHACIAKEVERIRHGKRDVYY
jgi:2-iminoacetate synthase